jgi:hypothetical protein
MKRLAKAHTLLFEAVEEAASPDEFSGEHAQGKENSESTGSRCDDHDDTNGEERESEQNLEEPLGLVDRLDDHFRFVCLSGRVTSIAAPVFHTLDAGS